MKHSESPLQGSMIERRNFIKLGACAAASIGMLDILPASAQAARVKRNSVVGGEAWEGWSGQADGD